MSKKSLYNEIYRENLLLKIGLLALLTSCGIIASEPVRAGGTENGVVIDNFSEYATGSAYVVTSNFWERTGSLSDNYIVEAGCLSEDRCISQNPSNEQRGNYVDLGGAPNFINQSFYGYAPSSGVSVIGGADDKNYPNMRSWQVLFVAGGQIKARCYTYEEGVASTTPAQTPSGNWYRIEVEWDNTDPFEEFIVTIFDIEDEFIAELTPTCPESGVVPATYLGVFDLRFNAKFDDFATLAPPELRVYGISPESESVITDTADDITIGWVHWNLEGIYKDLIFYFWEANTGIVTGQQIYEVEAKNGSITYDFSDFDFEKNGKYYLKAKARSYYSIEYGALYTTDLVDPTYWVEIDIEGWEEIFEMPDYEGWYAENVDRFATPTPVFINVTGFLSPIFGKIGEFISNALSFLDMGEAYQTGFDLGKIFPTFEQYVTAIEPFFGGFPILEMFKIVLLLLIGIFGVKFIFKFIP
jgi:hypothetical protein